ncbi:FHA domain-containing protein [Okeanomitos corallinicola TIOX110]|uniref:FHA domain-containing protein n=1 Tax=Okeanomitos corallinicola TIOX110 TaxID=3133117 RepID=A0ABZ2UQ40_9CYAN
MIVCPNCNHPNPDGAVQCEACYTPLPATTSCPSCGATVQADAAFCGQCGYNLHSHAAPASVEPTVVAETITANAPVEVPPLVAPDPMLELLQSDPLGVAAPATPAAASNLPPTVVSPAPQPIQTPPPPVPTPAPEAVAPPPPPVPIPAPEAVTPPPPPVPTPAPEAVTPPPPPVPTPAPEAVTPPPPPVPTPVSEAEPVGASRTQLQQVVARLFHVQSNQEIELPQNLSVIHIGKPNDRIPPDIDVAGFSNSEIVSRVHADIRIEGGSHYIEDVGSSNGTYINNLPLLPGNRHRLRPGDRISLGKGDLVTFLFQLS